MIYCYYRSWYCNSGDHHKKHFPFCVPPPHEIHAWASLTSCHTVAHTASAHTGSQLRRPLALTYSSLQLT